MTALHTARTPTVPRSCGASSTRGAACTRDAAVTFALGRALPGYDGPHLWHVCSTHAGPSLVAMLTDPDLGGLRPVVTAWLPDPAAQAADEQAEVVRLDAALARFLAAA